MRRAAASGLVFALAGCGSGAKLADAAGYGPEPVIPEPDYAWVAPIRIPEPLGWRQGRTPTAAPGLRVEAFATGLIHPRWMLQLPDGGLLVAESDGPAEPVKRPKDIVMQVMMSRAKAGVTPPNRISLLRDTDGDGIAETRTTYIDGA